MFRMKAHCSKKSKTTKKNSFALALLLYSDLPERIFIFIT